MPDVKDIPELKTFLSANATTTQIEEQTRGDTTLLRVTQLFDEGEGDQLLLAIEHGVMKLLKTDNSVDFSDVESLTAAFHGYDGTMSDAEHAVVAAEAVASVDVFKTGSGPSKGARACLWAARRLVHKATAKWMTTSDGTSTFFDELSRGGIQPVAADTLPAGAIIISPTMGRHVGHIGLLGEGSGGNRRVYSNHSPSKRDPVARWEQNYTVKSFTDYHHAIHLETYFFRLPNPVGVATS